MDVFYSKNFDGHICTLSAEESLHCVKVLRHKTGDEIAVIDGLGNMMRCRLIDCSLKEASAEIIETVSNWGGHPYHLSLAVCLTKNFDRYEWFVEKVCEIGADGIFPIIGEHSERQVFKGTRLEKIMISAAKQSLKSAIPTVHELMSVREFITRYGTNPSGEPTDNEHKESQQSQAERKQDTDNTLRMIAYCFENEKVPRISIIDALRQSDKKNIIVMIGPEGDFSQEEAELAIANGFIPVHLGASRLRTETAAVTAAEAVYFNFM